MIEGMNVAWSLWRLIVGRVVNLESSFPIKGVHIPQTPVKRKRVRSKQHT